MTFDLTPDAAREARRRFLVAAVAYRNAYRVNGFGYYRRRLKAQLEHAAELRRCERRNHSMKAA